MNKTIAYNDISFSDELKIKLQNERIFAIAAAYRAQFNESDE